MKIAVVIPTRGDRPEFLNHCKKMIHRQTYPPDEIIFVDYIPEKNNQIDLTKRYRSGLSMAIKKKCNYIVFWEDDDWYDEKYIEWSIKQWEYCDKPDVFGISSSYYFNIKIMKGAKFDHPGRSSMFCTSLHIKENINKVWTWPLDSERFLDLWIWRKWNTHSKNTVDFTDKIYTIGIKHGIGLTGGGGHDTSSNFYTDTYDSEWLKSHIDDYSYNFYCSL